MPPPLTFTHPLHHGTDPLHTQHPKPPKPSRPPHIVLGTLNIRDGRNSGLAIAIREFQQGNYDIVLATETKIPDDIYTKHTLGYEVICSKALPNQGGIALITRASPTGWHIESTQFHGPNVLSCLIVSGITRTPFIGAYLPPTSLDDLPFFEEALARFHSYTNIIAAGDFNADITDLTLPRNQAVAASFAAHGLFDLLAHYRQRKRHRHLQTWYQVREGTLLRSRCDYILGTDRRLFENVGLRDPRSYSTDHLMLRATLLRRPTKCHRKYLHGRKKFPLQLPKLGPLTLADTLYTGIKDRIHIPRGPARPNPPQWLSPNTIRLIDTRASLRRNKFHSRQQARLLTRQINQSLKEDRKARAEKAAQEIGACLSTDTPDLQGAWNIIKRWYRHASARQPNPSREDLHKVANDYAALYTAETPSPPGPPIPTHVAPFPILDGPPTEDEIAEAVRRLHNNRSPGASKIRAEHFKEWHAQAFPSSEEIEPDRSNWDLLLHLVTHMWNTGEIPTELTWTILVLIPKGDGTQTRGIGLNETLWKILEAIIDTRVKAAVVFHDILHGFIQRRGTGTAILEAKLAQELAALDNEPLFVIFLDLRKAYDTVDRTRSLQTFEEYGMGPNMLRLLRNYWTHQTVIPRQNGYHGTPFPASRGQTQGGLFAPTGFNIVMDSVIREWLHSSVDNAGNLVDQGLGFTVEERLALFYADDGYLGSRDGSWLANGLQILADLFRRVGLESNAAKTKSMSCLPPKVRTSFSESAYQRRATGVGATYRDRLREQIPCPDCGKLMARGSLPLHRRRQHGREPPIDWNHENLVSTAGQRYTVSFPNHLASCPCPVEGCPHSSRTRAGLRTHFNHRHWHDMIHILEEHPAIYPQCPRCGLHVPHTQLNNRHYNTDLCRKGMRRRANREAERTAFEASGVTFMLNNELLEKVDVFRYLGRLLSYNNSDWPTLYYNLKKAQQRWAMVARILVRDGASRRAMGMFYKGIVQAILLYGCETWTLTNPMIKVLEGFHHKVARRIAGMMPTRLPSGDWYYPPLADALEASGLFPLRTYVQRRQETIARYIVTRPIYQLCLIAAEAAAADGTDRTTRWWNQNLDEPEALDDPE